MTEGQADEFEQEEEEETEEEFDWKCRLLETIQLYLEVFDLANPRYKDRNKCDAAWEEIATAMEATGQSKNYLDILKFNSNQYCFLLCMLLYHGFSVDEVKKAWKNIRDPYRKKELEIQTRGDALAREGGGKRKSGLAGTTVAQTVQKWKFYERMSFYKLYTYTRQ